MSFVCELVPEDLAMFRDAFGYAHQLYIPMCRYPEQGQLRPTGIGILSRHAFTSTEDIFYAGHGSGLDIVDRTSEETKSATSRYSVAMASVGLGGDTFTIGTIHFPWTDGGRTSDFQRTACDTLLRLLKGCRLVLCGDFNAPRGREIFGRLAAQWTDHIPPMHATSIDPVLHRAGPLQLMVDGVFSTDDYSVSEVMLHQGVSDHCAVTAHVGKAR
jgi:endonuclease/exonuclease/phosphatase (EEP) superfamily protein YafD